MILWLKKTGGVYCFIWDRDNKVIIVIHKVVKRSEASLIIIVNAFCFSIKCEIRKERGAVI
jgi:hypothetical protein